MNKKEDLEKIQAQVFQNLRRLKGAPSVQMKNLPPPMYLEMDSDDEDMLTGSPSCFVPHILSSPGGMAN